MNLVLAEGGRARYTVAALSPESPAVMFAAEELCAFFGRMSGAAFCMEKGMPDSPRSIILGIRYTGGIFKEQEYAPLGKDGFMIRVSDENLYICAGTGRGVLYGAYDVLERAGVRFLTFEHTCVPEKRKLSVALESMTKIPDFPNRCFLNYEGMEELLFMARTRTNNEYRIMPEKYGGKLGWFKGLKGEKFHPTHNTLYYVDPKRWLSAHPEWFYTGENGEARELCYSSAGLTEDGCLDPSLKESPVYAAAETLKRFILNSDDVYFMIGQMDIADCCRCEKCLAEEKKYGRSGMNIRFVNAVARIINAWAEKEKIYRNIKLITFAYAWSQDPPAGTAEGVPDKSVIPEKNVIVRLAPISAENYFGLTEEGQSEKVASQISGWARLLGSSMTWTYHGCFGSYFVYYPTMRHWRRDMDLFKKINAEFVLMQGVYDEKNDWQGEIDYYVAAKMMWDRTEDPYALREDFIRLHYGAAAEEILEFINNFDARYEEMFSSDYEEGDLIPRSNISMAWTRLVNPALYSVNFWKTQFALLDAALEKAEQTAGKDERSEIVKRIKRVRLTPLFMALTGGKYPESRAEKERFTREFFDTAEELGVRHYREGKRSSLTDLKDILEGRAENVWGIFYEDRK